MDLEDALRESLREHTAEIQDWQPRSMPTPRRTGIARPALVGVTALAVAGAVGTGLAIRFGANDRPTVVAGHHPAYGPGPVTKTPPGSPSGGSGCVGQSVSPVDRFFSTPRQAVLDAESALARQAETARQSTALPTPAGEIRSRSETEYVDGRWTFILTRDPDRGWAVTETRYCPT